MNRVILFIVFTISSFSLTSEAFARTQQETQCMQRIWQKQYDKAILACRRAANQGSTEARFELGKLHLTKEAGTAYDPVSAVHWLQQAAKQEHREAMVMLANLYENGIGTQKSLQQAALWLGKAADAGHHEAQYRMARILLRGIGTAKNPQLAAQYAGQAANGGHEPAMFLYAELLATGKGIERNYQEAAIWFRKAAVKGNPDAEYELGKLYLEGKGVEKNVREGLEWIEKAVKKGSPWAQHNLAALLREGKLVSKNQARAEKLEAQAKEQNYPPAIVWYARKLEAEAKEIKDPAKKKEVMDKAFKLYQQAADLEYGPGYTRLGRAYLYGENVEPDYKMAADYFMKAVDVDYGPGYYWLANCYRDGKGVGEKNLQKAAEYYMKAAQLGVPEAQHEVGELYGKGIVLNQDYIKAYAWYNLAKANHFEHAGFGLAMMASELSAEDIIKAEKLSEELLARYGDIEPE